jgi:hypothetical protein
MNGMNSMSRRSGTTKENDLVSEHRGRVASPQALCAPRSGTNDR